MQPSREGKLLDDGKYTTDESPLLTINGFLLGATFLGFTFLPSASLTQSQVDDLRVAVAFDVASFICFLISTTATLCHSSLAHTINKLPGKQRENLPSGWLLFAMGSITAPLFTFLGMITLVVAVSNFVQVILGTSARNDDHLAVIAVSFLGTAGATIITMVIVTLLFSFHMALQTSKYHGGKDGTPEDNSDSAEKS